jgi:hypothetical protein
MLSNAKGEQQATVRWTKGGEQRWPQEIFQKFKKCPKTKAALWSKRSLSTHGNMFWKIWVKCRGGPQEPYGEQRKDHSTAYRWAEMPHYLLCLINVFGTHVKYGVRNGLKIVLCCIALLITHNSPSTYSNIEKGTRVTCYFSNCLQKYLSNLIVPPFNATDYRFVKPRIRVSPKKSPLTLETTLVRYYTFGNLI